MIYRIKSNTNYQLYHYSNQKMVYIDSVRRITTIRELNQNNFNYNQFYNKNNYHFTSKFNHIFINDLQNQIKHTLSPLSIIKSKIIPHRQCEAYYNLTHFEQNPLMFREKTKPLQGMNHME